MIEAKESGDRQLIRITAEKLLPDNFRLLQRYRHFSGFAKCPTKFAKWGKADIDRRGGTSRAVLG